MINLEKIQTYNNNKHCLIKTENNIFNVVNSLIGLHSARLITPFSTLNTRLDDFNPEELISETFTKNNLIKLRCMRTTLHTVNLDMAPIVHQSTKKIRNTICLGLLKKLNLTSSTVLYTEELIKSILQENELSSKEIENHLFIKKNININVTRAIIKKLWEDGIICYLNKSTYWGTEKRIYALTEKRYPTLFLEGISETDSLKKLIRIYIKQYGPVTEQDIVWWTGLPVSLIRKSLEHLKKELYIIHIKEIKSPFFLLDEDLETLKETENQSDFTNIKLLAYEDPFLKGYFESRLRYVSEKNYSALFNPIGEARSSIIKNGMIVGLWKWNKKSNTVETELFEKFSKNDSKILDIEVVKTIKCLSKNEKH
ncbi:MULTISPECIES: DNA glycosylase AlkZ-like family protein [Flavobacterium]|uniref:DNA glycosylase AlkZ-like family protein n=1 Tax=Flavobacterium TaxID=237 RepID=UPI0021159898|nr:MULTISPECIES: crosslink repair DNA glycosylase YcaQ family protein [Flavobacterium]UUF16752.1 winged helix DNA-binding domain-containing protein [Flavobacterium panici]